MGSAWLQKGSCLLLEQRENSEALGLIGCLGGRDPRPATEDSGVCEGRANLHDVQPGIEGILPSFILFVCRRH